MWKTVIQCKLPVTISYVGFQVSFFIIRLWAPHFPAVYFKKISTFKFKGKININSPTDGASLSRHQNGCSGLQCFGSGFRGLLDPDLESGSGLRIRIRIQGLKIRSKLLNHHKIIFLFTTLYLSIDLRNSLDPYWDFWLDPGVELIWIRNTAGQAPRLRNTLLRISALGGGGGWNGIYLGRYLSHPVTDRANTLLSTSYLLPLSALVCFHISITSTS